MLGAENLFGFRMREALEIHPTPLEWLRAGCRGVVIIDPQNRPTCCAALSRYRHLLLPMAALSVECWQCGLLALSCRPPSIGGRHELCGP